MEHKKKMVSEFDVDDFIDQLAESMKSGQDIRDFIKVWVESEIQNERKIQQDFLWKAFKKVFGREPTTFTAEKIMREAEQECVKDMINISNIHKEVDKTQRESRKELEGLVVKLNRKCIRIRADLTTRIEKILKDRWNHWQNWLNEAGARDYDANQIGHAVQNEVDLIKKDVLTEIKKVIQ